VVVEEEEEEVVVGGVPALVGMWLHAS